MRDGLWKDLWHDERRFLSRLGPALLIGAALAMTWCVFGPLDVTVRNATSLPFSYHDMLWPCLLGALLCTVTVGVGLGLLRGRVYDLFLSLAAGFLLASYLQGTFLNLPLGKLDGTAIAWGEHVMHTLANTALWCVLVSLPRLIWALYRKAWKKSLVFLAVLIMGMQSAALVELFLAPRDVNIQRDEYLSAVGLYEVSDKQNVLVFLLDRLDNAYIDQVRKKDTGFFDRLDGFTYYPDNISEYNGTFPSLPCMLTGAPYRFDQPAARYFASAWEKAQLLPALREAGYATKVYTGEWYAYSDIWQLHDQVDNISAGRLAPNKTKILKYTMLLTGYRYLPHALKATFWLSTSDFDKLVQVNAGDPPYVVDDYAFYQGLMQSGLSVQGQRKNFALYHLNGCHPPIQLTEDIRQVDASTVRAQTMGCFNIVYAYLDQLKALNLYKDATIIITGDHGIASGTETTGLFVKPAGSDDVPLVISHAPQSAAYFQATLLNAAGCAVPAQSPTYADIAADATEPRTIFCRVEDAAGQEECVQYEVVGDAQNKANWREVDRWPVQFAR